MACRCARVVCHRIDEAVGNVKLSAIDLPQVIMGEFMAEQRLQLLRSKEGEHWAGEGDMSLAGDVVERSIQLGAVLELVKSERQIELQLFHRLLGRLEQIAMAAGVQTVGRSQQLQSQVFGVI